MVGMGRGLAGLALAAGALALVRRRLQEQRADDLAGRVVLITGSSRGLGLAMAEEFARQGCRLVLCAREGERLEQARRRIAHLGADVLAVPCDVRDRDAVEDLIRTATDRFGQVDILVNNAGILSMGPLEARSHGDFRDAMDVMFWGTLHATFAVLPQMRRRRAGMIVNITSIGGRISAPHLLPYCAAKFAAVGFSEGLHAELAPAGISVLTVVPGFMRTGSYLNATFTGDHRAEFTWFSLLGNLPFTSIDGTSAARQIVGAVRRRESDWVVTPQALLASRVHGLLPGLTARLVALGTRALPDSPPPGEAREERGWDSQTPLTASPLTALGRSAAARFLQEQRR